MKLVIDHSIFIKKLTSWLVIISCFGYPLTLSIGILLNLNISIYNATIRILISLIGLTIISYNLLTSSIKISVFIISFLIFWFCYLTRLIIDLEFKGIRYLNESSSFIYMFIFGGILIPCFALITSNEFESLEIITSRILSVLIISNILLIIVLVINSDNIFAIFQYRSEIYSENKSGKIRVLNGITYSLQGSYLLVFCVSRLLLSYKKIPFAFFYILLSLVNMIIGASRGPLLNSFLTITILFFIFTYKEKTKSLKTLFLTVGSIIVILFITFQFVDFDDVALINRIMVTYEYGGQHKFEYRNYEWASAIDQFLNNPIFGDQFVVKFDNAYPHNIFLEVAMSTGFIGLSFFFIYLFFIFYDVICKKQVFEILAILILTFFTYQLSSSLFTGISFWVFTLFYSKYYLTPTMNKGNTIDE